MSSGLRVLAICGIVVVTAFAARLAYVWSFDPEFVNVDQYGNIGDSLYQGLGHTISSADDIGAERVDPPIRYPTAKRTPGMPLFVAAQYWLLGYQPRWTLVTQCLLDALATLLTFVLARRLLGGVWLPGLAALGYALYLPEFHMVVRLWTEPLFTVLLLGGTIVSMTCRRRGSVGLGFVVGLIRGLGILVRPSLLLFLLLEAPWLAGGGREGGARRASAYVFGCILMLAPWFVRNAIAFDGWIGLTTYGGYNLYVGHDTSHNGRYYDYSQLPDELKDRLRGLAEPEMDRVLRGEALQKIRQNGWATELRLFGLKAQRFFYQVDRSTERPSMKSLVVNSALLALAAFGTLVLLFRRRSEDPSLWLLISPVVYFFLLQTAFVARLRFLFPLLPFLLILAMIGLWALRPSGQRSRTVPSSE